MLSVVPLVLEIAQETLTSRKHRLLPMYESSNMRTAVEDHRDSSNPHAQHEEPTELASDSEPLLLLLLREVQYMAAFDSSGVMKQDMVALRALLSPS